MTLLDSLASSFSIATTQLSPTAAQSLFLELSYDHTVYRQTELTLCTAIFLPVPGMAFSAYELDSETSVSGASLSHT